MSPYLPEIADHLAERAATIAEAEGVSQAAANLEAIARLSALLLTWGDANRAAMGVAQAAEVLRLATNPAGEVEAQGVVLGLWWRECKG